MSYISSGGGGEELSYQSFTCEHERGVWLELLGDLDHYSAPGNILWREEGEGVERRKRGGERVGEGGENVK